MGTATRATRPDETEVMLLLDLVKDPCSVAAGTPLGLVEMGLIRGWDHDQDSRTLTVTFSVTSPACFLSGVMADAIRTALGSLPAVENVRVVIDGEHLWSHDDATPAGQARLARNRAAIVEIQGIRPQMWRSSTPSQEPTPSNTPGSGTPTVASDGRTGQVDAVNT